MEFRQSPSLNILIIFILCLVPSCTTQIYVGPNAGPGSGTIADPFRDFNSAFANLDIINNQLIVLPGVYNISAPFVMPTSNDNFS